ncbi:unnamed protein product [Microthlaspi erraticum]|uniref:Uncharacterized protein n=1 Tax=Microthlaspi erraticum TaxID=1685480 RepID=A0A6D2IIT8_9BRAS|nr:unnamed protein product [Microthlaspi erraticum]
MDTGNNNDIPTLLKSNFPPYGRDFPDGVPTGRFSDGKVPSDIIVVSSSNDLAETYLVRSIEFDRNSYAEYLAELASKFIKELSGLGAKKIGVFSGVPVGCLPFQRTLFGGLRRECFEDLNNMALHFNSKLSSNLDALKKELPGKLIFIDVYETLLDIIKTPENYGFEVADKGCCGTGVIELAVLCNQLTPFTCSDPSTHVFFDSYHPSEKAYHILTDKAMDKYLKYLSN